MNLNKVILLERLCMKIKATKSRLSNYFVLYDMDDMIVCYFDDFEELSKCINYNISQLFSLFMRYGNPIHIEIGHHKYKLFTDSVVKEEL